MRRARSLVSIICLLPLVGTADEPVPREEEAATKPTPLVAALSEAPREAKAGRSAAAEALIAQANKVHLAKEPERDILVAIELWSMAQEARNQARMGEAVELAGRAKKRLRQAIEKAGTQDDIAHVSQLRFALTAQFPDDDQKIDTRLADGKRESDLSGQKAREEGASK